ncbi:MAG: DUF6454 family protein [Nocardioidaceae bacterium]
MRLSLKRLALGGALAAVVGGAATTAWAGPVTTDGDLATSFMKVDRNTAWNQVDKLHLDFPTYHTEGLAITPDHIFLSSVQIIEPTQKYPTPVDGYDRTPGKGIGHLFVMDRQGHLQKDITLGEGDMYHPGGIDFDGSNIWVPVAQYRPNSSAIIYKVNAKTLNVSKQFEVNDHIGGIVLDPTTHRLVGNNWGSRRFYSWTLDGTQTDTWPNPNHFIDDQDCQYVETAKMLCGGVTNLPQTPSTGGAAGTYELGGLSLTDLHTHQILHEVPFQQWSTAGHAMTRNPLKLAGNGNAIDLWAAPDNGDEGNGTELWHFRATVPAP